MEVPLAHPSRAVPPTPAPRTQRPTQGSPTPEPIQNRPIPAPRNRPIPAPRTAGPIHSHAHIPHPSDSTPSTLDLPSVKAKPSRKGILCTKLHRPINQIKLSHYKRILKKRKGAIRNVEIRCTLKTAKKGLPSIGTPMVTGPPPRPQSDATAAKGVPEEEQYLPEGESPGPPPRPLSDATAAEGVPEEEQYLSDGDPTGKTQPGLFIQHVEDLTVVPELDMINDDISLLDSTMPYPLGRSTPKESLSLTSPQGQGRAHPQGTVEPPGTGSVVPDQALKEDIFIPAPKEEHQDPAPSQLTHEHSGVLLGSEELSSLIDDHPAELCERAHYGMEGEDIPQEGILGAPFTQTLTFDDTEVSDRSTAGHPLVHRRGKKHVNADALSRLGGGPNPREEFRLVFEDLPCGGSHYCIDEVDNVVPLATKSTSIRAVGEESTLPIPHSQVTLNFVGHPMRTSEENSRESPLESATLSEDRVREVLAGYPMRTSVEEDPREAPLESATLPEDRIREEQAQDEQLSPLQHGLIGKEEPDDGTRKLWDPGGGF